MTPEEDDDGDKTYKIVRLNDSLLYCPSHWISVCLVSHFMPVTSHFNLFTK